MRFTDMPDKMTVVVHEYKAVDSRPFILYQKIKAIEYDILVFIRFPFKDGGSKK